MRDLEFHFLVLRPNHLNGVGSQLRRRAFVVSGIRRVSYLLLRVGYLGIGMNRQLPILKRRRKLERLGKVWSTSGFWVWVRISSSSHQRSRVRGRSGQVEVDRRC
jgi:hypothetical protein